MKTFIRTFTVLLSLCLLNVSSAVEDICAGQTETSLCNESPETVCAEQCASDRHEEKEKCEMFYDVGLCFGLLSCIEDTESSLRQCINMTNTIFSMCAFRCYRKLLGNEVGK